MCFSNYHSTVCLCRSLSLSFSIERNGILHINIFVVELKSCFENWLGNLGTRKNICNFNKQQSAQTEIEQEIGQDLE